MLVNDRTWKVGCAMQNWSEGAATKVYFVCNYSYNNIVTLIWSILYHFWMKLK